MRTLLLTAVLGIVVASGCNLRPCKKGTVLLTIKVDPSASAVDTFDVALSIDGGASQHSFINRKPGTNEGTVEIDFAQGYMAGAQLTVAVTGTSNGASIAFGTTTQTLASGCQALAVTVGTSGAVKQVGEPAVPGDNCVTGHIVDGYCCEKACEGQCEACDDVPGKCQPVMGAPHGIRDTCGGADVQAPCGPQTCDGVTTSACSWPTAQCGSPSCTAGMATPAAMCGGGTCQPATPKTCPSGICGATDCATVTQVAAGDLHTCALLSDGTLRCWGANEHGQLGLGANDATDRHAPTPVPGLTNVKQVVAGHQHTCALMGDGTVQCWGSNTFGALGRGDYDNTDPVIVHGAPQPVVSAVGGPSFGNVAYLAAGPGGNAAHTCALLKDGEAWCWGLNSSGELGNGTTIFPMQGKGQAVPTAVCLTGMGCSTGATYSQIAVANVNTCALNAAGNIQCWGYNGFEQLGIAPNDTTPHPNPVTVVAGKQVVVGEVTVCMLTPDNSGKMKCWGGGYLGDGTTVTAGSMQATPQFACVTASCQNDILGQLANVSQISAGGNFVCVVRLGAVKCWGVNGSGQLGDGTSVASNNLASTTTITDNATSVTLGDAHACAIIADGSIRCWGSDTNGQLGDADPALANKNTPVTPHW